MHYFEVAVVQYSFCSHGASFSSKFKLERSEEAAASSAAMPQLKISSQRMRFSNETTSTVHGTVEK